MIFTCVVPVAITTMHTFTLRRRTFSWCHKFQELVSCRARRSSSWRSLELRSDPNLIPRRNTSGGKTLSVKAELITLGLQHSTRTALAAELLRPTTVIYIKPEPRHDMLGAGLGSGGVCMGGGGRREVGGRQ